MYDLCIVVPAYNEEQRIGRLLTDYLSFISQKNLLWQVLVVINNSTDRTVDIVRKFKDKYPDILSYVVLPFPTGKGGALIEGLRRASAVFLSYVDADNSVMVEDLFRIFNVAKDKRRAIVLGSRWMRGSRIIPPLDLKRKLASRCYNFLVNLLFGFHLSDTQCGGKVFHHRLFERIRQDLFIADMSFDVNLLFSSKRWGYELIEVPITWYNREGSKVDLVRTSLLMFLSVWRLRLYYSPFRFLVPIGERIFAPLRMRWTGRETSRYENRC